MHITIWDLDYYYSKKRVNCFNVDAMRLASYFKQRGDIVNFVYREEDIHRTFDQCYIFVEANNLPSPPICMITSDKTKWIGKGCVIREQSEMPLAALCCRPDYLLYPEKDTILERSDFINFFDATGKRLPIKQNSTNTFTNKTVAVADRYMWKASDEDLIEVFKYLQTFRYVSFVSEINVNRLFQTKQLAEEFLKIRVIGRTFVSLNTVPLDEAKAAIDLIHMWYKDKVKAKVVNVSIDAERHWDSFVSAIDDFLAIKEVIKYGRAKMVRVKIVEFENRLASPYAYLFERIGRWTNGKWYRTPWAEYISMMYDCGFNELDKMPPMMRFLVRHTYSDVDFCLCEWGKKPYIKEKINYNKLRRAFQYGL